MSVDVKINEKAALAHANKGLRLKREPLIPAYEEQTAKNSASKTLR